MPRRKRSDKRRVPLAGEAGDLFVHTDGHRPVFDFDAVYSSPFLARAAWRTCRADTWRHPLRSLWPPEGAIAYDGITATTREARPASASWNVEQVRLAVERDRASVARFRQDQPDAAAEIGTELDRYAEDLAVLLALAEDLGDKRDSLGLPMAARRQWEALEARASQGGDALERDHDDHAPTD